MFKSSDRKSETRSGGVQLNPDITFVGKGCRIDGDIHCAGDLRLEGEVNGNIQAQGDVEVALDGRHSGSTLQANNVTVHGHVKSCITARGTLRIHKQASVEGDVKAAALDIESGARFVGYSSTGVSVEADVVQIGQAVA